MRENNMLVGVIYRIMKNEEELGNLLMSSEQLLGKPVYCPLCRRKLKGWGEGCTVVYLFCENCGVELTLANTSVLDYKDVDDLEKELLNLFYRVSFRW